MRSVVQPPFDSRLDIKALDAETPLHGLPHELDVVQPPLDDHRTRQEQITL